MTAVTSVKLEDELKTRVQNLAAARRRTSHWIMREAIAQYVEREEKREAFREETLKAWEEFQETGLHASADDVEKWLSSWGSENELPTPKCQPYFCSCRAPRPRKAA
ncbi:MULTISPECIES: CopG family ribbon-helix-helix protein [unclassified Rhizobium]|uniref:CopG family ribbon-helix-helix protein n=1 Tax=unclassified Rhizobium TaxID=2613769 RepID=UPI000713BEF7|nr:MULTISPECIES: CopG family ribbon-helix-helix protein [unclassified Rhizobium]KQS97913.1 CopG family transcriptional regulator [Rhizobium sp. Leaf386]KQT00171.1 CopG family transcriptional regulator [Rhizobium sp. Leaf391]KQT97177.1 CopG family transcriptional regulator [Rhizobium sp. Leaf453]